MEVIDFSRSFVTFRIDTTKKPPVTLSHEPRFTMNSARVVLDCRLAVTDRTTGDSEAFVLGASCKTERVSVERDIWTEPNADFVPVFSATRFMHIKTYDHAGRAVDRYPSGGDEQPERQIERVADAFDDVRIDVSYREGARAETREDIIAAALRNDPLVARTELSSERYRAVIEYPVKTMNASPRDGIYQTDTGPVLLPDLSRERDELIAGMELAFVAFNSESWAEFLIRSPVPVADDVFVYHYSRTLRIDGAHNQIFRLGPGEP